MDGGVRAGMDRQVECATKNPEPLILTLLAAALALMALGRILWRG